MLKAALKKLRAVPPLNACVTAAVRGALRSTGRESEWVIRHLHRVGYVSERLPNGRELRLWSRGDDWVTNQIYWRGWNGYEPETGRVFFERAQKARVVLDVGAYVGYYTLLAAHANPQARVYAFEPHPAVYERLRRNVELNGLTNVECVNAAVGVTPGRTQFFAVGEGLPTSSSLSAEFMKVHHDVRPFEVEVVALDVFARAQGLVGVDLMKIDTESTEPDVLRGMPEILARDRPAIVCEVLAGRGSAPALDALLRPFGYRYHLLTPQGPQLRPQLEGDAVWLNHLFVGEGTIDAGS